MAKNDGYTKTGNSGLQKFANKLSVIPLLGPIISPFIGGVATLIETADHLFKGDIGSAGTALVAGAANNGIQAVQAGVIFASAGLMTPVVHTVFWGSKALIAGVTGKTVGTHARALTEGAIGGVTGALGMQPKVLQSNVAGIGGINGGFQSQRPGAWATQVSGQRGRNAGQDWRAAMDARQAEAQMMGAQR